MEQIPVLERRAEIQEKSVGLEAPFELFQSLNESGIRYCLWKSNIRQPEGMRGQTDLDLMKEIADLYDADFWVGDPPFEADGLRGRTLYLSRILFKEYELGWIAVLAALASGVLVGFINGILIAKVGVPSFMATPCRPRWTMSRRAGT